MDFITTSNTFIDHRESAEAPYPVFRQGDQIEVLAKEAEELRKKLDQERQKLNDIPSEGLAEKGAVRCF